MSGFQRNNLEKGLINAKENYDKIIPRVLSVDLPYFIEDGIRMVKEGGIKEKHYKLDDN